MKAIKILIKIFTVIVHVLFVICIVLWSIILGIILGGSDDVLCPIQPDVHCVCDVSVDCCCPTETVISSTSTQTPIECVCQTPSPTASDVPLRTNTSVVPSRTPARKTVTPAPPTETLPVHVTETATPVFTYIPPTVTRTPISSPTYIPSISPTATRLEPSATVEVCYQWLCHKPGTAAEQDYCCDSEGCISAHLGHGDYLGRCK